MISSHNKTFLVLGGARSGKSSYAEKLASHSSKKVIYIATAKTLDTEIKARINQHKQDRPKHWQTIEEPLALADTLQSNAKPNHLLLVDCLTMWLMNLLMLDNKGRCQYELEKLQKCISYLPGEIILVSNEIGMGIVPMGELTRNYVDEAGRLHQQLAQQVDNVIVMVAGIPQAIKGKTP